jgi:hypothetical protein
MPTFLQVVELPQRCFLREVLLWSTFQHLPIYDSDPGGFEVRESAFISKYCVANPDPWAKEPWDAFIRTSECRRAGIPPHPLVKETLESCLRYSPDLVEVLLNDYGVTREEIDLGGKQQDLEETFEAWKPLYDRAVEYYHSQIFVALRDGRLKAMGRLLGEAKLSDAISVMEEQGPKVEPSVIPATFWTLKGIDFENSAACDGVRLYCYITCKLDDVLALFPGERQAAEGLERVGDCFVLKDGLLPKSFASRGRPPSFDFDEFHPEVASMIRDGTLPAKKEAAIQYFQDWFQRRTGKKPSRALIGPKLTPYYDRFVRGQKI